MKIGKLLIIVFLCFVCGALFSQNLTLAEGINFISEDLKKWEIDSKIVIENNKDLQVIVGLKFILDPKQFPTRYDNAKYSWIVFSNLKKNLVKFKDFLNRNASLETITIITYPYSRTFKLIELMTLLERSIIENQNILTESTAVVNISTLKNLQMR